MTLKRELLLSIEFDKEMFDINKDHNLLDWVMSEAREISNKDQPEGLDVSLRKANKISVIIIVESENN